MILKSLPPLLEGSCRILILGSMPGAKSLEEQQYYAHPRNAFWPIMFALWGIDPVVDYRLKIALMLEHQWGLWDVIAQCRRQGSLDQDIRQAETHDFNALYHRYPNIKNVYFNGKKAYDLYRKEVGFDVQRSFLCLPSTSPAHAISFEEKLAAWSVLGELTKDSQIL